MDPIADIAVLGSPGSQDLSEQADAYEALTKEVACIEIDSLPPGERGRAYVLSLENIWVRRSVTNHGRGLSIEDDTGASGIESGMSGSPIVVGQKAVGVCCTGSGYNAYLTASLPGAGSLEVRG